MKFENVYGLVNCNCESNCYPIQIWYEKAASMFNSSLVGSLSSEVFCQTDKSHLGSFSSLTQGSVNHQAVVHC